MKKKEIEVTLKYQKLKEEKQSLEAKVSVVKYFDIKNSLDRLLRKASQTQIKQKETKKKKLKN
ncbi:MAG: hypothetical protein MZV70_01480 [Desulfobacterales bacterium]|nr:hypothetical protein [Desulfobacterales bacterium]